MGRHRTAAGPRRVAALTLVLSLSVSVLAACGGSSSDANASNEKQPDKRRSITANAADPRDACEFIVAGTAKRSISAPGDGLPYLIDADAEPTPCYDKVTFLFDPGGGEDLPPGYTVEYRKKPFDLPPGISTSTAGFKDAKFVLYVEITPASTTDVRNPRVKKDTYLGNLRLLLPDEIEHVNIVEWVDEVDKVDPTPDDQTDGRIVWLIGLDEKRPFTVDFANQPPRVSVLIMH
jgi:hypothetical protein